MRKMIRLQIVATVLFIIISTQTFGFNIKKELKNKLYENQKFPSAFHNVLLDSPPYQHVVYLNKKHEINHTKRKEIKPNKKDEIIHVRKNSVNHVTNTNQRKNSKIRKRTFLATQMKSNDVVDPLDRNRKKYFMETTTRGVKKDEVGARKYFTIPENDFFPFTNEKHHFSLFDEQEKDSRRTMERSRYPLANAVIQGVTNKEMVYPIGPVDDEKPVEFFLTENNRNTPMTERSSAQKSPEGIFSSPVPVFSPQIQTEQKDLNEQNKDDYIKPAHGFSEDKLVNNEETSNTPNSLPEDTDFTSPEGKFPQHQFANLPGKILDESTQLNSPHKSLSDIPQQENSRINEQGKTIYPSRDMNGRVSNGGRSDYIKQILGLPEEKLEKNEPTHTNSFPESVRFNGNEKQSMYPSRDFHMEGHEQQQQPVQSDAFQKVLQNDQRVTEVENNRGDSQMMESQQMQPQINQRLMGDHNKISQFDQRYENGQSGQDDQRLVDNEHKLQIDNKFIDQVPEEIAYKAKPYVANVDDKQEDSLNDKVNLFNRLVDKLHRARIDENDAEDKKLIMDERGENPDWQQAPFSVTQNVKGLPVNPSIFQPGYTPANERTDVEEPGRQQLRSNSNDGARYPTALQLSKAIMSSARMVDRPVYNSKSDINVNGQNLIPEVFEAFSKTNNDLKQRYIALKRWTSLASSNEQELELGEEIKSLNELSDMVHLVNNLEKDMLKTILKRKSRLGVSAGSKHEVIPGERYTKRTKSTKRFTNPNDVQELLQYIYDTYIENRTADDIPVVLQAFQKSVTDIVAKKSLNATNQVSNETSVLPAENKLNEANKSDKNETKKEVEKFYEYEDNSSRKDTDDDVSSDNESASDKAFRNDHKLRTLLDQSNNDGKNEPVITVKLLKALDLFLDSIEIGRKIKSFRAKVSEITEGMNGTMLLTGGMRTSLGELNREINETLWKSDRLNAEYNATQIGNADKSSSQEASTLKDKAYLERHNAHQENMPQVKVDIQIAERHHKKGHHRHKVVNIDPLLANESISNHSVSGPINITGQKEDTISTEKNGNGANVDAQRYYDYGYDENGIYYDNHDENEKNLQFEKEWYENTTLNPLHSVGVPNISTGGNESHFVNIDDHEHNVIYLDSSQSPYASIDHEYHDYEEHIDNHSSWNPHNISKLNKEALKGMKYYHKKIPYKKLTEEKLLNDTHHVWTANMTKLNKEAMKGDSYYHEQYKNDSESFDKEVQKIIDNAIMEAKNSTEIEIKAATNNNFYHKDHYFEHEMNLNDHFENGTTVGSHDDHILLPPEKIELHTMDKALKNDHVKNLLADTGVDKETVNETKDYLDEENEYISSMFYEENNATANNTNFPPIGTYHSPSGFDKKPEEKSETAHLDTGDRNWDKKDHTPNNKTKKEADVKNIMTHEPEIESFIQGDWDRRDLDFHRKSGKVEADDMAQIENLRKLVQNLQQEEDTKPEEQVFSKKTYEKVVVPKHKEASKKNTSIRGEVKLRNDTKGLHKQDDRLNKTKLANKETGNYDLQTSEDNSELDMINILSKLKKTEDKNESTNSKNVESDVKESKNIENTSTLKNKKNKEVSEQKKIEPKVELKTSEKDVLLKKVKDKSKLEAGEADIMSETLPEYKVVKVDSNKEENNNLSTGEKEMDLKKSERYSESKKDDQESKQGDLTAVLKKVGSELESKKKPETNKVETSSEIGKNKIETEVKKNESLSKLSKTNLEHVSELRGIDTANDVKPTENDVNKPSNRITKLADAYSQDYDVDSNIEELEKEISQIKHDKKTLDLVDQVVNGQVALNNKDSDMYKRKNVIKEDKGYELAHDMIEQINDAAFMGIDGNEKRDLHRVIIPNVRKVKKKKRSKIERERHRKSRVVVQHRHTKKVREKRGLIQKVPKKEKNVRKTKRKRDKKHQKKKWKQHKKNKKFITKNGTKKNLIASFKHLQNTSDTAVKNIILKHTFLNQLSEPQQKLVWSMIHSVYEQGNVEIESGNKRKTVPKNKLNTSNKDDRYDSVISNANALLKSFLVNTAGKKPKSNKATINQHKGNSVIHANNSTKGSPKRVPVDPYATLDYVISQPMGHQVSSTHGYPAITNPQGLPIHPNNVKDLQAGKLIPLVDDPRSQDEHRNESYVHFNNDTDNRDAISDSDELNSNKLSDGEEYNDLSEQENTNQFYFKDENDLQRIKYKRINDKNKKTRIYAPRIYTPINSVNKTEEEVGLTVTGAETATLNHSNSGIANVQISSTVNNANPNSLIEQETKAPESDENVLSVQPSRLTNSGIYGVKPHNKTDCKQDFSVITDGDDIFNLPSGRCSEKSVSSINKPDNITTDATTDDQCKEDFFILHKNGFDYKIPTLKCTPSNHGSIKEKDILRLSDLTGENATITHPKEGQTLAHVLNQTKCDPLYKTLLDGKSNYKIQVGCKEDDTRSVAPELNQVHSKEKYVKNNTMTGPENLIHSTAPVQKPVISQVPEMEKVTPFTNKTQCDPLYKTLSDGNTEYIVEIGCKENIKSSNTHQDLSERFSKAINGSVHAFSQVKPTKKIYKLIGTNRLIYKGKNVEMTQDKTGSEHIFVKGPNKTIEIDYPPLEDIHGFITLKQDNRLYKIPFKNHTNDHVKQKASSNLLGKSDVAYIPDYLRATMTDTETFKVKDTSINKKSYDNGAKVITMEKDQASLSIFYPPKNSTKKYNDTGYMTLKENGKTYNIPLDGNKSLKQHTSVVNKQIGRRLSIFDNFKEKLPNQVYASPQSQIRSHHQTVTPQMEYLQHNSPIDINTPSGNFVVPSSIKQVEIFNDKQVGDSTIKLTTDQLLNNMKLYVPENNQNSRKQKTRMLYDKNKMMKATDLMKLTAYKTRSYNNKPEIHGNGNGYQVDTKAGRRFKNDEHKYRPKPYQVDQFRHQKHLIEDNPKNSGTTVHLNDEGEGGYNDGDVGNFETKMHRNEQNDLEIFPPVSNHNFEFSHDKTSEELLKDIHESQKFLSSVMRFHTANDQLEPTEKLRREESQKYLSKTLNLPVESEEHVKLGDGISRLIAAPKQLMGASVDGGGWHDTYMDKLRDNAPPPVTPEQGSIFVGPETERAQNLQITPVSGPMNPEINDAERLNEFNRYAKRKNKIQGVSNKNTDKEDFYHTKYPESDKDQETEQSEKFDESGKNQQLSTFVAEIMSSTKGKELPNDVHQLQYIKQMQENALKVLGSEYKTLQSKSMDKYMHTATDKLDNNDKNELNRLVYNDNDFTTINKQANVNKRNDFGNVGIDVNGSKMGNVGLLLNEIPHVEG